MLPAGSLSRPAALLRKALSCVGIHMDRIQVRVFSPLLIYLRSGD